MNNHTPAAQAAYQAYGDATGGRTVDGRPMPAWDQLGDRIQHAWAAAVATVIPTTIPAGLDANPNAVHGYTDGCPHCPDGHRPAGSGTWHARVADDRDGDGQPTVIRVEHPAGAHISAADAEWVERRLNGPAVPTLPNPTQELAVRLADVHRPRLEPDIHANPAAQQYIAYCPACSPHRHQLWRIGDPIPTCSLWDAAVAAGLADPENGPTA